MQSYGHTYSTSVRSEYGVPRKTRSLIAENMFGLETWVDSRQRVGRLGPARSVGKCEACLSPKHNRQAQNQGIMTCKADICYRLFDQEKTGTLVYASARFTANYDPR